MDIFGRITERISKDKEIEFRKVRIGFRSLLREFYGNL